MLCQRIKTKKRKPNFLKMIRKRGKQGHRLRSSLRWKKLFDGAHYPQQRCSVVSTRAVKVSLQLTYFNSSILSFSSVSV